LGEFREKATLGGGEQVFSSQYLVREEKIFDDCRQAAGGESLTGLREKFFPTEPTGPIDSPRGFRTEIILGFLVNHNTPSPLFFISVDSKGS
jgi:hypothetical protein